MNNKNTVKAKKEIPPKNGKSNIYKKGKKKKKKDAHFLYTITAVTTHITLFISSRDFVKKVHQKKIK